MGILDMILGSLFRSATGSSSSWDSDLARDDGLDENGVCEGLDGDHDEHVECFDHEWESDHLDDDDPDDGYDDLEHDEWDHEDWKKDN